MYVVVRRLVYGLKTRRRPTGAPSSYQPPQNAGPHQLRQSTSDIRKTRTPITIRTTPTTCGSTVPPSVLTAQVRIAPKAIRIRLITIPMRPALPGGARNRTWEAVLSEHAPVAQRKSDGPTGEVRLGVRHDDFRRLFGISESVCGAAAAQVGCGGE